MKVEEDAVRSSSYSDCDPGPSCVRQIRALSASPRGVFNRFDFARLVHATACGGSRILVQLSTGTQYGPVKLLDDIHTLLRPISPIVWPMWTVFARLRMVAGPHDRQGARTETRRRFR